MIEEIKDEKQGVAPYEFAKALAFSVVPTEILNQSSERLIEQIALATLASAATGEENKIEITIEVKNGIPDGLRSKLISQSYEKLKEMTEDEMVKAVLPTLIMKLKNDAARDAIKSFNLSDMLRDTKESQEQDAQAAS